MSFLFARRPAASDAHRRAENLHDHLVAAVCRPVFYLRFGVADTFEGRFDLLVLHVAVVLRRLRAHGPKGEQVAQELVDTMFARFDIALREMGVSDLGVPKRMKRLAEAFNGRTAAYLDAFDAGDREALAVAIGRNVLGGSADGHALAQYVRDIDNVLSSADLAVADQLPPLPEPRLTS